MTDVQARVPDWVEWPTIAVAVAIAAGFSAVLAWHERLPTAVTILVLAVLSGWYGSLQHEVIHGHPTPWQRCNTALAIVPLGLVVRFGGYRDSHLAHHATLSLTDPVLDPESFYVSPVRWATAGSMARALMVARATLAGRLVLGPLALAARHWRRPGLTRTVVGHIIGVAAVLAVVAASGLSLWVYVLGAAWGGLAVTLLRSFVEHRAVDGGTRSAVVRTNPALALLFLNNNLHHTHHARPGLAWFELPAANEALGSDAAAAAGAGWYRGYGEIARRHLFRPFDLPSRHGVEWDHGLDVDQLTA